MWLKIVGFRYLHINLLSVTLFGTAAWKIFLTDLLTTMKKKWKKINTACLRARQISIKLRCFVNRDLSFTKMSVNTVIMSMTCLPDSTCTQNCQLLMFANYQLELHKRRLLNVSLLTDLTCYQCCSYNDFLGTIQVRNNFIHMLSNLCFFFLIL